MPSLPPLKPPARADRIRALRRTPEHSALTSHAIEELFRGARVLTEGGLAGDPAERWFGSIMITFDLAPLAANDEELARVADAIEGSVRVRLRAHRLACAQVRERFPDRELGTVSVETRFRREGRALLVDVDLEAPIELPSSRRRAR